MSEAKEGIFVDVDYSKSAFMKFLVMLGTQGLLNPSTAAGWAVACSRLLEDIKDGDDVRRVDPAAAIKRYHNKHPGELKGTVLKEYQRRLTYALGDFVKYNDDPTGYAGRGRGPTKDTPSTKSTKQKAKKKVPLVEVPITATAPAAASSPPISRRDANSTDLFFDYPLRSDFLAQVVVPRDLKTDEARRLCGFIMTLAADYQPKENG